MQAQVPALLQPQMTDCWKPKMLSPIPMAMRAAPL